MKIRNLTVEIGDKTILSNLDLDVTKTKNVVLFGPNASGKSTLLGAIMGFDEYRVTSGSIEFEGKEITGLRPDERARLGVGTMFQRPPKIRGIKLGQLADLLAARNSNRQEKEELTEILKLDYLLDRDLYVDLSGGEIKRSELFVLLLQSPKLLLLDEPESGVDLDNVAVMSKAINHYLHHHQVSALIITHTGYILDYVDAAEGCVLNENKIICRNEPGYIFETIKKHGYEKCRECPEILE